MDYNGLKEAKANVLAVVRKDLHRKEYAKTMQARTTHYPCVHIVPLSMS